MTQMNLFAHCSCVFAVVRRASDATRKTNADEALETVEVITTKTRAHRMDRPVDQEMHATMTWPQSKYLLRSGSTTLNTCVKFCFYQFFLIFSNLLKGRLSWPIANYFDNRELKIHTYKNKCYQCF